MNEYLKVVVKLPNNKSEVMSAFPLLHAIKEFIRPTDFHLIATKESFELLTLLPFNAYFHEFDALENTNILDIHRYSVQEKALSNVDIFFALSNETNDKFMSLFFRGKERVGFEGKWNAFFLNKKKEMPIGLHKAEEFFSLLSFYNLTSLGEYKKVKGKEFDILVPDWDENPYLMVNLPYDPINNEVPPDWSEFFELIGERKVFISCFEAGEKNQKNVVERFMTTLESKEGIYSFYFTTVSEFARLCQYAQGVVSQNLMLAEVSCYLGVQTICLFERGEPRKIAPLYFSGQCNIHDAQDISLLKKPGEMKSEDIVTKFDLGKLADKLGILFPEPKQD